MTDTTPETVLPPELFLIVTPDGQPWARTNTPVAAVAAADHLGEGATVLTTAGTVHRCLSQRRLSPPPRVTEGGFLYRQTAHKLCGSDADRQSVGEAGHCEDCCAVGHLHAHPDLGCGDVGCYRSHDDGGESPEYRGLTAAERGDPVSARALAVWLLEQITLDRQIAQAGFSDQSDPEHGWGTDDVTTANPAGMRPAVSVKRVITPHVGIIHEQAARTHIVTWHPGRVTDECDAKREIVGWCAEVAGDLDLSRYDVFGSLAGVRDAMAVMLAVETLRRLARPYVTAGRSGYREEWGARRGG